MLEIPEGTAKTRLRRARQCLGEEIERCAGDPGLAASTQSDLETWAAQLKARLSG